MTDAADIASPPIDEEAPDAELPKMSFLDHLEELRKRLIVSIIAIFVAFIACWNYADKIFALDPGAADEVPSAGRSEAGLHAADRAVFPLHEGGLLRGDLRGLADPDVAGVALHLARPLQTRAPLRRAVHHLRDALLRRRRLLRLPRHPSRNLRVFRRDRQAVQADDQGGRVFLVRQHDRPGLGRWCSKRRS